MKPLKGKVVVVAGATRGAGRGIACTLGEAGAVVYCTGRGTRENRKARGKKKVDPFDYSSRPETIEETAEMVTERGGVGLAVQVDHTIEEQVKELFARVRKEQKRLDVLAHCIADGIASIPFGTPFWECSLEEGLDMIERAFRMHIITSRYAVPLMIEAKRGLIVRLTDALNFSYRGHLFFDLVVMNVIRFAFSMGEELRKHKITSVSMTPGFLRSEAILEHFGVTEENWQEGAKKFQSFIASETPFYVGRAVLALATDKSVIKKTGQFLSSYTLAQEYGFTDVDGRQPNFGKYFFG